MANGCNLAKSYVWIKIAFFTPMFKKISELLTGTLFFNPLFLFLTFSRLLKMQIRDQKIAYISLILREELFLLP
jgi:hypothetical protein